VQLLSKSRPRQPPRGTRVGRIAPGKCDSRASCLLMSLDLLFLIVSPPRFTPILNTASGVALYVLASLQRERESHEHSNTAPLRQQVVPVLHHSQLHSKPEAKTSLDRVETNTVPILVISDAHLQASKCELPMYSTPCLETIVRKRYQVYFNPHPTTFTTL
jgi:hypothetical protein